MEDRWLAQATLLAVLDPESVNLEDAVLDAEVASWPVVRRESTPNLRCAALSQFLGGHAPEAQRIPEPLPGSRRIACPLRQRRTR
jgi:hypothetical protein